MDSSEIILILHEMRVGGDSAGLRSFSEKISSNYSKSIANDCHPKLVKPITVVLIISRNRIIIPEKAFKARTLLP